MKSFFVITALAIFAGCAQSQNGNNNRNEKIPEGSTVKPKTTEAVAYFSEGCFWHTEIVFQSLIGVRDAV